MCVCVGGGGGGGGCEIVFGDSLGGGTAILIGRQTYSSVGYM